MTSANSAPEGRPADVNDQDQQPDSASEVQSQQVRPEGDGEASTGDVDENGNDNANNVEPGDDDNAGDGNAEKSRETRTSEQEIQESLNNIKEREQKLALLSKDDKDRPQALLDVASHIADHHVLAKTEGIEDLLRALDLTKEAYETSQPDNFWHGSALFSRQAICLTLYNATGDPDWLQKGQDAGRESIAFLEAHEQEINPAFYKTFYSMRSARLASCLKAMYDDPEIGGERAQLESALVWQGNATDACCCEQHCPGNFENHMEYFRKWCQWCILLSDVKDDFHMTGVLDLALSKANGLGIGFQETGHYYNILHLLARQWAQTKKPEHLDQLIEKARDYARSLIERDRGGQYVTDATNDLHVLRAYATVFEEEVQNEFPIFKEHLPSVETVVALWEEVFSRIGWKTVSDLQEATDPVIHLTELYGDRYNLSKIPEHGWMYDDMNYRNCQMCVTISLLKDTGKEEISFSEGSMSSTIGTSIVTGQKFIVWEEGADKKWDMRKVRLVFMETDENSKPTAENWIRGYNDDGTYDIGGAIEGRDDDVLEFIKNYSKPLAAKEKDSGVTGSELPGPENPESK